MVTILHISDLHIFECATWNNMKATLFEEVENKVKKLNDGEKLVIITGDFHNYTDDNYEKSKDFLKQLFKKMKIDPTKDVFVVPGNHDVANNSVMNKFFEHEPDWKMEQRAAIECIKKGDNEYIKWRYKAFKAYCEFIKELKIYPKDVDYLPAQVHVRNWRGKLNILHLNTVLVADGSEKDNQRIDTYTATNDNIWENNFISSIPSIAIGHNSFFDLNQNQQTEIIPVFYRKNVSAYLCGDQHRINRERDKQMIRLEQGYMNSIEIPNVVCMNGGASQSDFFSEFGFYWHIWDEITNEVTLDARMLERSDQSKFVSYQKSGHYVMRCKKDTNNDFSIILDKSFSKDTNNNKKILENNKQIVKSKYFNYLANELGIIQFDGIPTDKNTGSAKVDLENIFVPLEFSYIPKENEKHTKESFTIGKILEMNKRVALLAKPGGGKSTLIRRIALAYAFNDRKIRVDDDLPDRDWFPIYIRCRDLGENVQSSIKDNIYAIINRAELSQYKNEFIELIDEYVEKNKILLLIDGLDEISNEQHRIKFVNQLYTFVNEYSKVHIILTSRETGFRIVAEKLSQYCKQYAISDLSKNKIRELSKKWHEAFLDNMTQANEDANSVCSIIFQDPRIIALARNPLLLTTLLFVKRWLGYLPTKKCQLYQEMIKLLLVSWNTVAHIKMDLDEAEPQLAFIAYEMTKRGKQTIQKTELLKCIEEARKFLPGLLGYTRVSPKEFIDQVEERSSILIRQGFEKDEKGDTVPYYEFSHLSFQEYLTAKAIAEGWISQKKQGKSIYMSILEEHLTENQWREVIPLTAVLLKQQVEPAMEYLIKICKDKPVNQLKEEKEKKSIAALHLANCIAAEVQIVPTLLEEALSMIITYSSEIQIECLLDGKNDIDVFITINNSEKYGKIFEQVVNKQLFENEEIDKFPNVANVWCTIYFEKNGNIDLEEISRLLKSYAHRDRISGAALMAKWVFEKRKIFSFKRSKIKSTETMEKEIDEIYALILKILCGTDMIEYFFAIWCIAWSGYNEVNIIPSKYNQKILSRLVDLWCDISDSKELRRLISWAICSVSQSKLNINFNKNVADACDIYINHPKNEYDYTAAIFLKLLAGKIDIKSIDDDKLLEEYRESNFIKEMKKR